MDSVVSPEILGYMEHSSWIRRMFEAGIELKKKYGDDQVYDFSLGNPDMPPPPEVKAALLDFAQTADQPYAIGYMPNAGFADTQLLRNAITTLSVISRSDYDEAESLVKRAKAMPSVTLGSSSGSGG